MRTARYKLTEQQYTYPDANGLWDHATPEQDAPYLRIGQDVVVGSVGGLVVVRTTGVGASLAGRVHGRGEEVAPSGGALIGIDGRRNLKSVESSKPIVLPGGQYIGPFSQVLRAVVTYLFAASKRPDS